jgi:DNA replication protein DnaC
MMIKGYRSEVLSLYELIREREANALKTRKKEIQELHPEIIAVDQEIGKLSLSLSMNILKNHDDVAPVITNLKNKIMDLRAKKYEMLVQNGYPQNYLNIRYTCSKCKDTGYIGIEQCECYKRKLIKVYYKNSELSDTVRNNNFDNFDLSLFSSHRVGDEKFSPRKNMESIFQDIITRYMPSFKQHNENLLFYGDPGTGKTYLTNCIARELLDSGVLVVYRTADELIKNLREVRFDNNKILEELLINCDLLIIDDLGTEQITEFSIAELFNLLNVKLLRKKKMIISTNLTLTDITKTYTERIGSRLIGNFKLHKFYGDDIRVQINLKKNRS